ncbi:MAG TPA: hypothetical protein VEW94_06275 [Chloroflexia bacterium]|nr:hypothetical protein [Chloroflexia bacterium]
MPPRLSGLSLEGLGHLNYIRSVLAQPPGSWDGFYQAQSPSMNFALRYQLAFGAYAVAMLSQHTPAYRAPYAEALRGAIEKMLDVAAWGYWRVPQTPSGGSLLASSGHVAVLISPHQRAVAGPPSDPVAQDNLQYSGHLSTMLGLYEKVTGDGRYDGPFTLADPESGVSYTYTHGEVAGRIYSQMRENSFGGVCCERGMAYVPCNNHALASNTLHDALHGTTYGKANEGWLRTVRRKMVLKGPSVRGVFGTTYVKDAHVATPFAFNFTDVWGLAFMLPFDRPLVRKLYGKFKQKVTKAGEGAYVSSSSVSEKMEISDVPINTGFGLALARGIGDSKLAGALDRYARTEFEAGWQGTHYLYKGAPRTIHSTALYALAGAVNLGGENFTRLFRDPPNRAAFAQPSLTHISGQSDQIGVSRAEYDAQERSVYIGLRHVGDAAHARQMEREEVTLHFENVNARASIGIDGVFLGEGEYKHGIDGRVEFAVSIEGSRETACIVRLS